MATAQALGKAGPRYGDLKRRLVFLVLALVVYRLGTHIPVPGINPDTLADLFRQNQGGILGMFNMFSGGALSRFSIFALGIMPYISASIIMQLMSVVMPTLEAIKKEGEFAIAGFGTFRLSKRAARKGRNPQTGEAIKIKASKGVRFKASKTLKDTL